MEKTSTRYLFFSGKGGVGKTTMACASAVHYAARGNKTLIVTTDPASNLADVFEQKIGHVVTPINGVPNLSALEIDPDKATFEYREKILSPFRQLMPADVIASLEEQFNSPCTTEIASFERFVDFMVADAYAIIIFDTAPTGHTIRLLELPVEWSKFIEDTASRNGQSCLGPVQAIQDSKEKYDKAIALLRDKQRTTFILVMRPDRLSLFETQRAFKELEGIGIQSAELIINGLIPRDVCDTDFFNNQFDRQQEIIRQAESLLNLSKKYVPLKDNEVKGIDSLVETADELFSAGSRFRALERKRVERRVFQPYVKPDIDNLFVPNGNQKNIFFTGKGGVGKTTLSCIVALYLADKGCKTLLVTTDPAAHIGEVLDKKVGHAPLSITENLSAVLELLHNSNSETLAA